MDVGLISKMTNVVLMIYVVSILKMMLDVMLISKRCEVDGCSIDHEDSDERTVVIQRKQKNIT